MSIHTNATPKSTEIRVENKLRPADSLPPQKSQESVELELSLPMLFVIIVAIGIVIYAGFSFFGKKGGNVAGEKTAPTTLADGLADVKISLDNITSTGSSKAKYIFIEISDFECPYCKGFSVGFEGETQSSYEQIVKRYVDSGVMKYGFAPYIAVAAHKPAATNEALGFYCAAAQGKAFEYHKAVFQKTNANGLGIDNKQTTRDSLLNLAQSVGLNVQDFAACYDKRDIVKLDQVQEQIDKEIKTPWGDKFGANNFGTPAFAVCKISADNPATCVGKAYVGAWPYADMKGVIDTFLGSDAPKSN